MKPWNWPRDYRANCMWRHIMASCGTRVHQTIISRNKVLVREILCYMIGANEPSYTEQVLLQRYRRETGDVKVELPSQLV